MKKLFLIIIFIIAINQTFACTCVVEKISLVKKVKKEFKRSDLVFSGKVLEIIDNETGKTTYSGYPLIYKFEIIQVFKGKVETKILEVISVRSSISCGYEFKLGETYLVYSINSDFYNNYTRNDSDFITSLCDRNNLLSNIKKKELRKLESLSKRAN